MKCPHCNNELKVDTVVYMNADIYQRTNIIVTKCCGNPVYITPIRKYEVTKYKGDRTEDDWGNDIKQNKTVTQVLSSEERLRELVYFYNSQESKNITPELLIELAECKKEIHEIISQNHELGPVELKPYNIDFKRNWYYK